MDVRERIAAALRAPAPVPARPPGSVVAPPDFVGVGAQRCGTSGWYDLICRHPQVHRRDGRKEVAFFDRLLGRPEADVRGYAEHFPRPAGLLCGEWTPRYLVDPWTVPLLLRAAPGARLLVRLRDPVERYESALRFRARIDQEPGRNPLSRDVAGEALARGFYGAQVSCLLDLAGEERVLVLQHERCLADPAGELARTFAFLGLDPAHAAAIAARARPQNATDTATVLSGLEREALGALYAADAQLLGERVPSIDLGLWGGIRV